MVSPAGRARNGALDRLLVRAPFLPSPWARGCADQLAVLTTLDTARRGGAVAVVSEAGLSPVARPTKLLDGSVPLSSDGVYAAGDGPS